MSAKHSLVILAPNGRRHTVNVTQNTSIQEVLEIVCKKHDLDFNEWDLKHYNRIIELANSVRFSGLPNNASLEMVQSSKPRKETTITLVLQLESGKRLKHEFSSSVNLWDILTHWQNNGEQISLEQPDTSASLATDIQPVCIYMRQEIVGEEQLQKTTLRSLGLTHGTACIRLIHRSQSQLKHQANISAPLSRPTTSNVNVAMEEDTSQKPVPLSENTKRARSPSPPLEVIKPKPESETREDEPMEADDEETSREAAAAALESKPTDLSQNSDSRKGTTEPVYIHPENKLAQDGQLNILGEQDACLYYSGDVSRLDLKADYDDSFYKITEQDVQRRQRDLRQMREQLENAPLRTAEARESEKQVLERKVLLEHPKTVIKVRFPNGYILQGIFRTDDTIDTVAAFVKKYLVDPNLSFYLLITPPRTILQNELRLIDLNLIRSAVIYFGCDVTGVEFLKQELYSKLSCPNAIREHIQRKMRAEGGNVTQAQGANNANSTVQERNRSANTTANSTNIGGSHIPGQGTSSGPTTSPQRPTSSSRPAAQNSGIVPKWFKK